MQAVHADDMQTIPADRADTTQPTKDRQHYSVYFFGHCVYTALICVGFAEIADDCGKPLRRPVVSLESMHNRSGS